MEYAYATCLLSETDAEINKANLKAVLEAAGSATQESRIKAVVAAVEDDELSPPSVTDTEQSEQSTSQQSEQT